MKALLTVVLFVAAPCWAYDPMPAVESEVFTTTGTAPEIAKRGEICIARLVRYDSVNIADSTNGSGPLAGAMDNPFRASGKAQEIAGGSVVVSHSPETGMVVANNRLPYKALMNAGVFQSTLTFESKDGRFRITHSAIQDATLNTGMVHNEGFKPVYDKSGLAKRAKEALQKQSTSIAKCVMNSQSDDW